MNDDLVRRIYGPPGTGKTHVLTGMAIKAAERYGPERVACLTFTRAAAEELRLRIAAAMGMSPPSDPWKRRAYWTQHLPWVGTIHSLALRLIGRVPVLRPRDVTDFVRAQGGRPDAEYPDPDEIESYAWTEPERDEVEGALAIYAMARHRLITIRDAFEAVPWTESGPPVGPERAEYLATAYRDFKKQVDRIDFEDMLELGLLESLPVDVVLADEVQDNSPLLWKVLDTWAEGRLYGMAGDPYQAIYIFSGAEPDLFIEHPGTLISLGDSRRLTAESAERAQRVLRQAGFLEREWLGSWTGVGHGVPQDGTTMYLARTNRLLRPITRQLEDDGTPYRYLRGGGPLETKAAQAYRVLHALRVGRGVVTGGVALLADQCAPGWIGYGAKARLGRQAREDPELLWDAAAVAQALQADLGSLHGGLKHGEYFERVALGRYGPLAFLERPATAVGTIHAAKGREADDVHLVESWGTLPYRAIHNGQHQAEACVAYVALTRHRRALVFEPSSEGVPYPW